MANISSLVKIRALALNIKYDFLVKFCLDLDHCKIDCPNLEIYIFNFFLGK